MSPFTTAITSYWSFASKVPLPSMEFTMFPFVARPVIISDLVSFEKILAQITLIAIIATASVFMGIKLNKSIKTKDIGWTEYTVAGINAETGKIEESLISVSTEDYFNVDGLECKLQDEADVTYRLFFYDADKTFISATEELSDSEFTVPESAEFVRIQITSLLDDNVETLEVRGLAKQLTVTVNK